MKNEIELLTQRVQETEKLGSKIEGGEKNKKTAVGVGLTLITLGCTGFGTAFSAFGSGRGDIPSLSMFVIMLGLAFYYPSTLQERKGEVSTMRVIVFMVVSAFVVITIKIGWSAESFDEFQIDRTWLYILAFAFGSKAIQKFAELKDDKKEDEII